MPAGSHAILRRGADDAADPLQTGSRVKQVRHAVGGLARRGRATPEAMAQAMARHEKERINAARRRAAKKQAI